MKKDGVRPFAETSNHFFTLLTLVCLLTWPDATLATLSLQW